MARGTKRRKRGMLFRRRPAWSSGQSFTEFGLLALPTLILLFGIVTLGIAIYSYSAVCDAAREGVRYAIVHGATSPSPASASDIQTFVLSQVNGLSTGALTIAPSWTPDNKPGSVVKVQVTYNFKPLFPLSGVTLALSSSSQMVISQ
jgi:Flp pilus assembly protein TadG